MKSWPRLVMVIVACLMAIALPAAPAQASDGQISLSPSRGVPGEEITIRGHNFTAYEWVDIYFYTNGDWERRDVRTDGGGRFSLAFEVPESYKGAHRVHAVDETGIYADADFTVDPGLIVTPQEGPVGTTVTVEGQGFGRYEESIELRFYVNDTYDVVREDIEANARGSWEESFQIPRSARGSHSIRARGDESSLAAVRPTTFEVIPAISIIDEASGNAIEEPAGTVGESITMTGTAFAALERHISILFAGQALVMDIRADDRGYWEESFEVPEMPGDTYAVTAEGEETEKEDLDDLDFEIRPGIELSPTQGHVGLNLTVIGRGFAPNEHVDIMYEGSQEATAQTNNKGTFEAIFSVPESPHGEPKVTAAPAAGNNATAIFTMESDPPPTPDLISPPDGDRIGFVGTIRPRFEWSEVEDPSGVYYRLQISASANTTAEGDFVDPVVSREGLVGGNYTLGNTEGLPHGTYYWTVQAVDGAENAGNWTAVYSFRAGLLPLWAFIVIIVFAALLIGGLVYFLVVRRRMYF